MESQELIRAVVSSDAVLPLAAERLSKKLNVKVTEYDIIEYVTGDESTATEVAKGLRSLLVVRVFDMIMQLQNVLLAKIDELDAKDAARTYSSMVTVFNALTTPAAKVTFDFGAEVRKAADEFGMSPEEIERELKSLSAVGK